MVRLYGDVTCDRQAESILRSLQPIAPERHGLWPPSTQAHFEQEKLKGMDMSKEPIKHYITCNPNYPEKPEGEAPREEVVIELDVELDEQVRQCVDCGALVVERKKR